MGTRTNFYKNPSYAYNKQLNLKSVLQNLDSYNIATGNAPPGEPATAVKLKRHRETRPSPSLDQRNEVVKENDGPMSHHDYIEKRRKEAGASQPYQELTADVLESSSPAFNLVGYESDRSTTADSEEDEGPAGNSEELFNSSSVMQYFPIPGSTGEADRIKTQSEQRYPAPGEPVCVMCGYYGEYICDEEPQSEQLAVGPLSARRCTLEVPESGGDTWDYDRHCWSKKISGLCTYECWKCHKPGHLAEDCLVLASHSGSSSAGNVAVVQSISNKEFSRDLLYLYKRCRQIGKNLLGAKCNSCRGSTTLATCVSCNTTYCDCAGHLTEHIREHPTHQQYYSYKLKRLVKCCKSTCKVTDIKNLLACHYCLDKAFDKFYDMYSATWKPSGLSIISNSICCEDHFEWHRMNCLSADVGDNAYILKNEHVRNGKCIQLSDFIF
ncbi:hypothetical protein ACS0TY_001428 [Phlomoides rotata]